MKKIAATLAAVALATLGVGAAVVLASEQATTSLATCEQSVTEGLLANRIVAASQSYRKDNPSEYAAVRAYLDGAARPTGNLTHMGIHLVALEDTCRALNVTTTTTTTTSTTTTTTTTPPPPPPPGEPAPIAGQGYSKVFGDEFDALGSTTWGQGIWYDPGAPANSIFVQNGILNLVSRRSQGYQNITITTESVTPPIVFTRGYFEARMKWTKGAGAWPAFWLLSYRHAVNPSYPSVNAYCSQNGLPAAQCYSAELDVFEGQGTEPTVYYGTIHRNSCGCYGVGNTQNSNNYTNTGTDLTTAFHTYGMLWTATTVSWYLDGNLLKSAPVYDSTNQPMFLLLQMWIGGWTSGTTSSTPDELKTEVDWVRVWQK